MKKIRNKYAFVVLNWNGKKDTKLCLDSLNNIDYGDPFDIIIVDNGSTDGSVPYLKKQIAKMKKGAQLVSLPENRGFTGGHIAGLAATDADIICLLNNDAVVAPNILDEVDNIVSNHCPDFGAIGGRAYFWNTSQKPFDIWNEFFTSQKVDPITATAMTLKGDPNESLAPQIADNVSGACVFINRRAIDLAGYLDDEFFAYYEETDLLARFKRLGFEAYYCPTVRYWHRFEPSVGSHGASSQHIKNFSASLIARNQFYFAFKNFEGKYLIRFLLWYYYRFIASLFRLALPGHRNLSKIYIKTTLSNFAKLPMLIRKRREVSKLCKNTPGYNSIIIRNEQTRTIVFKDNLSNKDVVSFLEANFSGNNKVHLRASRSCGFNFPHRCVMLRVGSSHAINSIGAASSRTNNTLVIRASDIDLPTLQRELSKKYPTKYPYKKETASLTVFNKAFINQICDSHTKFDHDLDWNQKPKRGYIRIKITRVMNHLLRRIETVWLYLAWRLRTNGRLDLVRAIFGLITNTASNPKRAVDIIQAGAHKQRMYASRNKQEKTVFLDNFDARQLPVFINCRDRLEPLLDTIESIKHAGLHNIYLLDNKSSYPPLLEYYKNSRYQVIQLGENMGHKAPWESKAVRLIAGERPYIVTDPDIVLSNKCAVSTVQEMLKVMDEYPGYAKIGPALRIDDLPNHYSHKKTVVSWESQFWKKELKTSTSLQLFDAEIDTTFAIYRQNSNYITLPGIRVGGDYCARHLAWYSNSKNLNAEEKYYQTHASSAVNSWNKDFLPDYLIEHA